MNDWIEIDEAYLYFRNATAPYKGKVAHTRNGSNSYAWFVKDGSSFENGLGVPDEEGRADDCYVWFKRQVPREMVLSAFKEYFEDYIRAAKSDIEYYTGTMRNLGIETEDEG